MDAEARFVVDLLAGYINRRLPALHYQEEVRAEVADKLSPVMGKHFGGLMGGLTNSEWAATHPEEAELLRLIAVLAATSIATVMLHKQQPAPVVHEETEPKDETGTANLPAIKF